MSVNIEGCYQDAEQERRGRYITPNKRTRLRRGRLRDQAGQQAKLQVQLDVLVHWLIAVCG